jgi:hypothetical protein
VLTAGGSFAQGQKVMRAVAGDDVLFLRANGLGANCECKRSTANEKSDTLASKTNVRGDAGR